MDLTERPRSQSAEGGSLRPLFRDAAAHRVDRVAGRLRLAGRRVDDRAARAPQRPRRRCRSTKCISAGGSAPTAARAHDLSRAGGRARALRARHGLHAHRAAAGDGASVHRLVGLSGDRLLRADQPLRHAGRLPLLRRRVPPGRHRRDPRLGAGPLSRRTSTGSRASTARRSTSTPIRGRASTRTGARWSSTTAATKCASFLLEQRALLAERIPHRRPARRCRGLDALPRLLARGRAVGAEPVRRPREPRGHRVPQAAQQCSSRTSMPGRWRDAPKNPRRGPA